jgi:hypothetical protein
MAFNADYFLKKTLGEDFFESLSKFELWKPGTRTTVDHEEIKTALMIVPRTVMALLIRELTPMQIGETKEIVLPVSANPNHPMVRLTKHERDVYSGEIFEDNKMIVDFKYRSIPGIGLVIMSAFELYDTSKLVEQPSEAATPELVQKEDPTLKLQYMIDERLALHDLIGKVVDKKIEEREAIKQLLMAKLTPNVTPVPDFSERSQEIVDNGPSYPKAEVVEKAMEEGFKEGVKAAKSPLVGFLDKRKAKAKPPEFKIKVVDGETVRCPDCGNALITGDVFTGCVCLGDDMDKKVFINKSEDGIKIRFGRGWDVENIEMLLEVLRSKR